MLNSSNKKLLGIAVGDRVPYDVITLRLHHGGFTTAASNQCLMQSVVGDYFKQ